MPSTLSMKEAGTVPIVGGTALQCLRCLEPSSPSNNPCTATTSQLPLANLTIVITSGSGGTGYLGVQMAKV